MTYHHHTLRPAMTAIAAVIALSTAPAFAQIVETTPPIVDAAPAVPDALAPEPAVTTTAEPVANETATTPPPAAARTTTAARQPVARVRPSAARNTASTRPVAATPVAVPPVAEDTPLVPTAPEAAVAPPVAEPAPVEQPPVSIEGMSMDEALPIAGAAGLGLFALLGAGFAMRRRRRRADEAIEQAKWQHIQAAPEEAFESAPTFVRTPKPDPVPVTAPAAANAASPLPDGFDVSRFGPHVQAAYRGPTPDNPSSSLKRRLTVGHFLDKKAAEAAPASASAIAKPATLKPHFAGGTDADFMFRRSDSKPTVRPAYQK